MVLGNERQQFSNSSIITVRGIVFKTPLFNVKDGGLIRNKIHKEIIPYVTVQAKEGIT